MTFEIPGKLPGMNEIIQAAKCGKKSYQPYNELKRQYTDEITWLAKKLPSYNTVIVIITWYEPSARRDIDNITAGTKFIMDALVNAEVIKDDSQRYVKGIFHKFGIDRKNPRIEVEVREFEEID